LVTPFVGARPAGHPSLSVAPNLPGLYNVLNAAAAIAVASNEGVDDDAIVEGLGEFSGVNRRFTRLGSLAFAGGSAELVDDYGHHPTEVRATLDSARQAWPDRRVVMIYQPHRFSRTRDLYEDFVAVLSRCDVLLLLDVYPAGEEPISGADSRSLTRSIRQRGQIEPIFVESPEEVPAILADVLRDGDVVIAQGAGDIGRLAQNLAGLDALEADS